MSAGLRNSALDDLRAAVAGRASREVGRDAVYRMLAASTRQPEERSRARGDAEYDRAIDLALESLPAALASREAVRQEAQDLATQIAEVARASPVEARSRAIRTGADLRPELLVELSRLSDRAALDEPVHAIVLAGIAVALSETSRPSADDLAGHDLLAQARRALAEAAFRGGDLIAAEGALNEAKRLASRGTRDALLRADLLRLESEILCDQSHFQRARQLAQRSVALFQRAGDVRLEARSRVSLALKFGYEGRLVDALAETERALALIDPAVDGRWVLAAEFNRTYWLADVGRSSAARASLPRLAELVESHGKALDRVRYDWLVARIAAAEGDLDRAAELYRPVLDRCLELETIYDSAIVALELAVVLLELGRAEEVLPLADTVAPIFKAQGVEPEAAAAVLLAAESLRRGVAAREVLGRLLTVRAAARHGR